MDTTVKIADSYINLLSSFSDEIKLRVIREDFQRVTCL